MKFDELELPMKEAYDAFLRQLLASQVSPGG